MDSLPAISKYGIKVSPELKKEEMNDKIPASIRWKADNYNHLHEQPPVFYAATLALCFLGVSHGPCWNRWEEYAY
jgi:hypothetical protein